MTEEVVVATNVKEIPANPIAPSPDFEARELKTREKLRLVSEKLATLEAQAELDKKDLSDKIESSEKVKKSLERKVIEAELKAYAISEGITDIDFVKLMDASALQIAENGSIDGLSKVISDFKTAKPNLFRTEKKTSSSSNISLPATDTSSNTTFNALKASEDDYEAQKIKLLSGR